MTPYLCLRCGDHHTTPDSAKVCCAGYEALPLTGGSSDYYRLPITKPLEGDPYEAQCLDVICALGMTFAEGEAFKAIWRKAAARMGNGKPGGTAMYDAEKVAFFGAQMVRMEG